MISFFKQTGLGQQDVGTFAKRGSLVVYEIAMEVPMTNKAKKKLKFLKKAAGRQDWNGLSPVTKIVPDKKKAKPDRKAKHKGRLPQAGSDFLALTPSHQPQPRL